MRHFKHLAQQNQKVPFHHTIRGKNIQSVKEQSNFSISRMTVHIIACSFTVLLKEILVLFIKSTSSFVNFTVRSASIIIVILIWSMFHV